MDYIEYGFVDELEKIAGAGDPETLAKSLGEADEALSRSERARRASAAALGRAAGAARRAGEAVDRTLERSRRFLASVPPPSEFLEFAREALPSAEPKPPPGFLRRYWPGIAIGGAALGGGLLYMRGRKRRG